MSRFIRENANVEIRGITFEQFYRNACDRFEYYRGGDPEAAAQNFCCEIEKMMGILPNISPSEPKDAGSGEGLSGQWRHKGKGTIYTVIGQACAQASKPLENGDTVVIYRSEDDPQIWVRRKSEFLDGRFDHITRTAPSGAKPGEVG